MTLIAHKIAIIIKFITGTMYINKIKRHIHAVILYFLPFPIGLTNSLSLNVVKKTISNKITITDLDIDSIFFLIIQVSMKITI